MRAVEALAKDIESALERIGNPEEFRSHVAAALYRYQIATRRATERKEIKPWDGRVCSIHRQLRYPCAVCKGGGKPWPKESVKMSEEMLRDDAFCECGSRVVSDPPFMASIFNDFAVQLSHIINDMLVQELNKRMVAKKPGPQRRQSKPKKDRREKRPPKAYTKAWWKSKAHVSTL
jgi:hypothetical protein